MTKHKSSITSFEAEIEAVLEKQDDTEDNASWPEDDVELPSSVDDWEEEEDDLEEDLEEGEHEND